MITALVAARGGSVRLPHKALLPFAGTTLIGHKVRQLKQCREIDRVVVNTDSAEIGRAAIAEGAFAIAGKDYNGDTREMLYDSACQVDADVIVWAHPTNPLVSPETYDRAVWDYRDGLSVGYDSLVSVYRVQRHAWYRGAPLNYAPAATRHALAADVEPVWFQDGAIFIQSRERFMQTRYFFGDEPLMFETPASEVSDIDLAADYKAAVRL